jgi:hypothetical protein
VYPPRAAERPRVGRFRRAVSVVVLLPLVRLSSFFFTPVLPCSPFGSSFSRGAFDAGAA